jgi:hypothetical protein
MSKDLSQVRVRELVNEALAGNATHIEELRRASHEQLHLAGKRLEVSSALGVQLCCEC